MASEYDNIHDLWYRYEYERLNEFLAPYLRRSAGLRVLDAGCGSGFQTVQFAATGAKVWGMDISPELVNMAAKKLLDTGSQSSVQVSDLQAIPFLDGSFDVVCCLGSTLSFIPDYRKAVEEMARVLRPGGRILIEVENKWNLDMFWATLNALMFDILDYGEDLRSSLEWARHPLKEGFWGYSKFNQVETEGEIDLFMRFFTPTEVSELLESQGLRRKRAMGIHILTNVVPSTLLCKPDPSALSQRAFGLLAAIERVMASAPGLRSFGATYVIEAEKY
jgi:ubiquinone/menaquinone biosynthesis C-methylase UbiE